jgi:unsaturated chondroitin disaccharide hydrolase
MAATAPQLDVQSALRFAFSRVDGNLAPFADIYPDDTTVDDIYRPRRAQAGQPAGCNAGWTTGFWPGMIWLSYDLTKDEKYRTAGEHHIKSFADRMANKIDVDHHDLGFLYSTTCVTPWKLAGNEQGKRVAVQAAGQLMHRFWDKPGIFQAWGTMDDPQQRGRTIIDSLMNMPLLYWASDVTGDKKYRDAAYRHAGQLRDHIVRPDNTTFHTFFWNPQTGAPLFGNTAQGAKDDSCWARGHAWGIYGFALNYAHTHDAGLLQTACRLADYFIAKLPKDKVAYWDLVYTDGSSEERDSSAAAIAACGLLEIARSLPAGPDRDRYASTAQEILASLANHYTSKDVPGSNSLLMHSVYSKPAGHGVDEGCLWGDYFYMEGLLRLSRPDWQMYW